ncbi:Tn7-like element transposition protein TnsE [Clostridium sp. OS1-26]|uniref:Tn7-like element transposition protein TnsE n=1 Tax=Clostridium sp. OS1-26 TaxID=3070681 RepID=UPI0027E00C91|nr:Tn7-like element transposition protein TnsE [Clostridium sp. OS1-26]WML36200.1 Tn7-like element transposition protein TnsE [Clostridium sp. OS1-26]
MRREAVKIKDWPFEKGEKVRLTWIGEPFKENNKWMVNTYFKGSKVTRRITLDWASIHFLSVEKYYTDGNLNNGEVLEKEDIIEINLNGVKAEYKERDWVNSGSEFKDKTKSKTFNFIKNGILYTIPIIEIIRAVLAPDRFMLNRIVEMDTLENYFTYEINGSKLDIHFASEYEEKLLKSEKVNHIAWILTNPKIFKMFNSIGQNIWQLGELKFDFLFDKFNIKARVEKKETYIRVLEIVSLRKKRINVEEVNIYHPSLDETVSANEIKKRTYINRNTNSDRELDSGADGATKSSDEINTFLITHEYETVPRINKVKSGRKIKRTKEDENTKKYISENEKLRTTADIGGQDIIKGLEFTSIENIEEKGELEEFVEILRLLQKRYDVKFVEIIIGELPEGKKGKRFSRLSDGITKRKYAIGKITMIDGREYSLIEIEREDKALSMLLLKANVQINWEWIYRILLIKLVDEGGKWSNEIINKTKEKECTVCRIKHINRLAYENEDFLYRKLKREII